MATQRQRRAGAEGSRGARVREVKLHRQVLEDLRQVPLRGTFTEGIRDLYGFYLNADQRARLERMGRVRRLFRPTLWLLKNLLLKLSPARRLLLVLALVLFVLSSTKLDLVGSHLQIETWPWVALILLTLLMLELKDKLVARDEIEVARHVQLSLLPREHPSLPGWQVWSYTRPANDVGGDLVDYIRIADDRLGVVLADVAGKGMGAALLSARLQAVLRALQPDCGRLDALARRLNEAFHRDGIDNRFATFFYLEIDSGAGRVRFVNAGHNPALALRGGELAALPSSSFPLGMFPVAEYEERWVDLAPGDLLFVYSDGITEASNPLEEEFGETRLSRGLLEAGALEPAAMGRRILALVERFQAGRRPNDDQSLVIVRRAPRP